MPAPNGLDHDTLRAIAERFPPYRAEGKGYRCRCPVHDDHDPSLDVTMGSKGVPVVNCRAGCDQDKVWAAVRPPRQPKPAARRIVAVYPYPDEQGVVLYEVVRFDPKDFRQRLPDGTWKLGDTRRVLYRLPEIVAADEVVIVEGEKAADRLAALGVAATCSPGGAGKWRKAYAPTLKGKHVIVLPDNDEPGRKHGRDVAFALARIAKSLRVLELPGLPDKGDVADWLEQGHTIDELRALVRAREDWTESTIPQAPRAGDARAHEGWTSLLKRRGENFVKHEFNIFVALRHAPELQGRLRLNELSNEIECRDLPWTPGKDWVVWGQTGNARLAEWLQDRAIDVRPTQCATCVEAEAFSNPHHPVKEYFAGLAWDGTPRLSAWLATHLGAHDAPEAYLVAVGRAWLVSAVARVYEPGCQADHVLVLEGQQGIRKSTALASLLPDRAWFADEVATLGTKDHAQDLRGKVLIELSELAAMKRAEIDKTKSGLSRRFDHYRPSYERYSRDFPRQCVFAGTTNEHAYLLDDTGNRRFWCVLCGRIDVDAIVRDRGQLWAEAIHAYKAGEKWYLAPEVEALAAEEQAKRAVEEDWAHDVLTWANEQAKPFTAHDVLIKALQLTDASKRDDKATKRVVRVLRTHGYVSARTKLARLWAKPEPSPATVTKNPLDINAGDGMTVMTPDSSHTHAHASARVTRAGAHMPDPCKTSVTTVTTDAALKTNEKMVASPGDVSPPWDAFREWHSRVHAGDVRAGMKAWLNAAGGILGEHEARVPKALPEGDAKRWLIDNLYGLGLRVRYV